MTDQLVAGLNNFESKSSSLHTDWLASLVSKNGYFQSKIATKK
jgi:hypothetical protein